jgi:hypothetical protein
MTVNNRLYTYAPDRVVLAFGPVILGGFAEGTFINWEYNEDFFNLIMGIDGESARGKSNNNSARITAILMQTSASNDLLSAIHAADILSPNGDGINPLLLKDLNGRTLQTAEKAWIVKPPSAGFNRAPDANREWTFETNHGLPFIGGS